ncbi:hypothetical protein HPB52_000061 [Rhipicephalus sanguineus]|uniref:Store-operated calcium entry-associated regulatory factor n=1 Tax=Rhipicephalus sanguineus TaxID=34632 RepID=A0A9D4SML8_RHISA|nr:hypothetical protein HPB52_000061 [Rhipicephalus sanguineus]
MCTQPLTYTLTYAGDKVKLTDVRVLTLRQGYYTTGRRSHPVPQLHCRGGSAGCKHQPSVVQCYNRGTDGWDVQWECKAEMKETQKFGWMQVSCEGYDHRKDEYVLVGSCGDAPSCCAAYQPLINQPATYPSAPPPAPHPQGNPPPYYLNYTFAGQNPNADSGFAGTERR